MGVVFTDTFPGADGALGGLWSVASGSVAIVNHTATPGDAGVYNLATNPANLSSADNGAECIIPGSLSQGYPRVSCRSDSTGANRYELAWYQAGSTLYFMKWVSGNLTVLGSAAGFSRTPGNHTLRVTALGTTIRYWFDGALVAEYTDYSVASGLYIAIGGYGQGSGVSLVRALATPWETLTVEEPALVAGLAGQLLHVTGPDSTWTPGTPGSPAFTLSTGTITSQTVTDSHHATLTVTAPTTFGLVIVTDPDSGLSGVVSVSTGVGADAQALITYLLSQGGYGAISPETLASLELFLSDWMSLISHSPGGIALEDLVTVLQYMSSWLTVQNGSPATIDDLAAITDNLGAKGSEDPTVRGLVAQYGDDIYGELHATLPEPRSIRDAVDDARTAALGAEGALSDLTNAGDETLATVRAYLTGDGGYSHRTLYNQLYGLTNEGIYTLGDILDAIDSIGSVDLSGLTTAVGYISDDSTIGLREIERLLHLLSEDGGYTVGDVDRHVVGLAGENGLTLAGVRTAIANILAQQDYGLYALRGQLDAIRTTGGLTLGSIDTSISNVRGSGAPTIADVLTAIGSLGPAGDGPKAWPGEEGVTYLTPVPLAGDTIVNVPMDGAVVSLATVPPGSGGFGVGDLHWYYRIGHWAFYTDSGAVEPWAYLSASEGLLMPARLRRAGGLVVQCPTGVTGVITPFVIGS